MGVRVCRSDLRCLCALRRHDAPTQGQERTREGGEGVRQLPAIAGRARGSDRQCAWVCVGEWVRVARRGLITGQVRWKIGGFPSATNDKRATSRMRHGRGLEGQTASEVMRCEMRCRNHLSQNG